MAADPVRMWRAPEHHRVLLMAGRTTHYAIEPRGEYVFGVVDEQPMRSLRGRERRLVRPGQLVAWDPSQAHAGVAVDGRPWASRLMVVEVADLAALADDPERDPLADVVFPGRSSPTGRSPSHSSGCTPPWTLPRLGSSATSGSRNGCAR